MSYRLTKIYTRKGDDGYTKIKNSRISKNDALIEALGNIDELNCAIGLIFALDIKSPVSNHLTQIQHDLFDLGGELYFPEKIAITKEKVIALEKKIDEWNKILPPLKEFILPRGNLKAAHTHMSRAICRRAERTLVTLHQLHPIQNKQIISYVNRLSDFLFVLARIFLLEDAQKEELWKHEK